MIEVCQEPHGPPLFETMASSIFEKYNLRKQDVSKKVTGKHIDKISHSCCKEWKRLPSYLDMEGIVGEDISGSQATEEEKKRNFFSKWVDTKGSGATYEKLIGALLEINCINDAETVCKLIQPPLALQSAQPPAQPPAQSSSHCTDSAGIYFAVADPGGFLGFGRTPL
jgi:hypothetical protein